MKFPRTEVEERKEFPVLKEGKATFKVLSSSDGISRAGNDMLILKLKLRDEDGAIGGTSDHLTYLESMRYKIKHAMESVGLKYEDETTDPALEMEGKCGTCVIKYNGEYLEIKDYLVSDAPVEFKDDVPF